MMIDTSQAIIRYISVHGIGNGSKGGTLKLSDQPLHVESDLVHSLLLSYFTASFRLPEYYCFSSDLSKEINPVHKAVRNIFNDESALHANSIVLAEQLYQITQHPNIKSGELYTVYFSGLDIKGKTYNALGVFKSETKEKYLKLSERKRNYQVSAEEGININKLDKGCIILDDNAAEGYRILVVDTSNHTDAHFWKDDFLGLSPLLDAFHQTHNFMNLTRQYVGDQLDEEFSVSKADKIDLLNRSMDFFKSREEFNQKEFENEVLGDDSVIKSFRNYEKTFMSEADIADNFEISAQAVKRQARVFKSVLKLDKNFHIYIHGNRDLIEKGYDEVTKRHYYKIYFDQES